VLSVLRGEGRPATRRATGSPPSAHGLLGGGVDTWAREPDVPVPPELVADLHHPDLIITPGFVGVERRRRLGDVDRWGTQPVRSRRRRLVWARRALFVLGIAVAVAVLALIASPGPVQAVPHTGSRAESASSARALRSSRVAQRRADRSAARDLRAAAERSRRAGIGPSPTAAAPATAGALAAPACSVSTPVTPARCARLQVADERRVRQAARQAARAERRELLAGSGRSRTAGSRRGQTAPTGP
jgi:hypothetical protein